MEASKRLPFRNLFEFKSQVKNCSTFFCSSEPWKPKAESPSKPESGPADVPEFLAVTTSPGQKKPNNKGKAPAVAENDPLELEVAELVATSAMVVAAAKVKLAQEGRFSKKAKAFSQEAAAKQDGKA